jgi:hypothetical protein
MHKTLLLFIFILFAGLLKAQPGKNLDLGLFKDRNITVKNAVAGGLFIVQQQYIAVDSAGKEYGFNNQDNFGTVYSVGLRVKEGIVLPTTFNTPGLFDANFEPYRAGYTTRTSGIQYRHVDSVKFDALKVTDLQAEVPRINQPATVEYFPLKQYKDIKEGKLVIVFSEDVAKVETESVKTFIVQVEELEWDVKGLSQPKNLLLGNRSVIGGVLFHEEVSFGKVLYQPVAFFENINGAWVLQAIDMKQSPGGLSPIEKKKK